MIQMMTETEALPPESVSSSRLRRLHGMTFTQYVAYLTPMVGHYHATMIANLAFGHGGDCIVLLPEPDQDLSDEQSRSS